MFGQVRTERDIIGFGDATLDGTRRAFHETVDAYLASCEAAGDAPSPPGSSPAFESAVVRWTHRGYTGVLEIDEEADELYGRVVGMKRDGISFVGRTVAEARDCFHRSGDFYLDRFAATGKKPEQPTNPAAITDTPEGE